MTNNFDRIKEMDEKKNNRSKTSFSNQSNIFHKFEDGENIVRLGGSFVMVKTHYIYPDEKRKLRGTCKKMAFEGKGAELKKVINCPDWDIDAEAPTKEKTCPYCAMFFHADDQLKNNPDLTEAEKKYYEEIKKNTRISTQFKWNIIDRKRPFVSEEDSNGNKKEVKGWKVGSVGSELWGFVHALFKSLGFDIAGDKDGIDIRVVKEYNPDMKRVCYKAETIMDKDENNNFMLRKTPLDEEEKQMEKRDLKRICGKMTPVETLLKYTHEDMLELLEKIGYKYMPKEDGDDSFLDDNDVPQDDEPQEPEPKPQVKEEPKPVEKTPVVEEKPTDTKEAEAKEILNRVMGETTSQKPQEQPAEKPQDAFGEEEISTGGNSLTPACFGSFDSADENCTDCGFVESCKIEKERLNG